MNQGSFFAELKRRNVYKVAVAYAVVGWLVMQVAATIVPALHLPDVITTAVVVLTLFIGFVGTTGLSDFPEPCIIGVRPPAFPMRPAAPSAAGDSRISRFSRMEIPRVRGVCDRAGPPVVSRSRRRACGLPLRITASAP